MFRFILKKQSSLTHARLGELSTVHGKIETPFFMTIATRGVVKTLDYEDLESLRVPIVLGNTYHLWLRPGIATIKKAGGLHAFMNWPKPILTDSGGYQVFSLSKLRKIRDEGVEFVSPESGDKHFLTPEKAVEIQMALGSDMMMVLDECPSAGWDYAKVKESLALTHAWARRSKEYFDNKLADENNTVFLKKKSAHPVRGQALFGIVQGGRFKKLRQESARVLGDMGFDGYAIGGVSVGETRAQVRKVVEYTAPLLPSDKPRYLMGLGRPEDIIHAVRAGVDMFDCVIPTREARHARLYFWCSPRAAGAVSLWPGVAYKTFTLRNACFVNDFSPINPDSSLEILRNYTKAYLHHLFAASDPLALRLATLNNVEFYIGLMGKIHTSIEKGKM